jgi:hypothetical protein
MTESNHPVRMRDLVPIVLSAALCCAVGACGSGSDSSSSKTSGNASSSAAASTSAGAIDGCSLLSPDDISALLGTTVQGKSTSTDPQMPACTWENPESYESVSLEIGNPGTAPNNTLPPPEPGFPEVGTPGPDGMRYLGGGQVEFPAGSRSNTVQVAVLKLSADDANAAAVDLARKIGPKIPA